MISQDMISNFSSELNDITHSQKNKKFFGMEITTTELCNCRCSYCFEGYDKIIPHVNDRFVYISRAIDELISDERFNEQYKGLTLTMWGGEPTLNMPLIEDLIDKYALYPRISWHFYTNGILTDNLYKLANKFKDYGVLNRVSFQLSWDGEPVHDMHRKLKSSSSEKASDYVKQSFKMLYNMGANVTFKATILPEDFEYMYDAWVSYKEFLEDFLGKDYRDVNIAYAPTIDQTYRGDGDNLEMFKKSIAKISKMEIDYIKKHGSPLLSWFDSGMKTCPYRNNMCCIDMNGNVYSCHGVQYDDSAKKDEFLGNIYKDNKEWMDSILDNTYELNFSDECLLCPATYCAICCVQSASCSNLDTPYDRWYDRTAQNGLCKYYRAFGAYSKALHYYVITGNE